MLRPISSPLGARDLNFLANLKILARFFQILSYGLTLKVKSPPILMRSFDAHTYTLTIYWRNKMFMKEGIFSLWSIEKEGLLFERNWSSSILKLGSVRGASSNFECVCMYIYIYTHTHTHTDILKQNYRNGVLMKSL